MELFGDFITSLLNLVKTTTSAKYAPQIDKLSKTLVLLGTDQQNGSTVHQGNARLEVNKNAPGAKFHLVLHIHLTFRHYNTIFLKLFQRKY